MIKWIQVGLLSLIILLLSYQDGMAAPAKKPLSKDSEFNDPLLEEEAQMEEEEAQLEMEALDARDNTPLEENKLPDPPPPKEVVKESPPEKAEMEKVETAESKVGAPSSKESPKETQATVRKGSPKNPQFSDETVKKSSPKNADSKKVKTQESEVIIDNELDAMVNLGDSAGGEASPKMTAALPKWDPQDPHKGFISADEEGGYNYKEDGIDDVREYKGDYKIVPKASNYKRGLLYVTSDGSYVYGGEDSPKEGAASVRIAQMQPLPLENDIGVTFSDMYGDSPLPIVLFDYDWLAFRKFGHWILSIGTGLLKTEGAGRFVDDYTEANERYTFYMLLNHISFTYRFQYSDHPWFVPYFSGGAVPAILAERRDDNKRNKSKFVPAAQVAGGVRLNIGKLDSYGAASLDAEYGINNMWLDVEARRIQSFDEQIDISSNLINMGLGFDF